MNEQALLFGPGKSLAAVVTEPAAPGGGPALILLNAGVLHHVGPNRLHVRLARELALRGGTTLRFDLSGLGDSRGRSDGTSFAEATVAEAREAMDALQATRGITSFVVGGLCSGADNALRIAAADPRVRGALLVEPMSVPLSGFLVYSYRKKFLNPASWWRFLTGKSELFATLRARRAAPAAAPVAEAGSLVPSGEEFQARVDALVRRGVSLYFAYSSESPAYVNYRSLLKARLAGEVAAGRARVLAVAKTDHVFTPLAAQRALVGGIADWMGSLRG